MSQSNHSPSGKRCKDHLPRLSLDDSWLLHLSRTRDSGGGGGKFHFEAPSKLLRAIQVDMEVKASSISDRIADQCRISIPGCGQGGKRKFYN